MPLQDSLAFSFTNIAREAGLNARTVFGGEKDRHISARDQRGAVQPLSTTMATAGSTSFSSTAPCSKVFQRAASQPIIWVQE